MNKIKQAPSMCNPPASERKEEAIPEKKSEASLRNRPPTGFQGLRGGQGYLSKIFSRRQREPAKPSLTLEEFRQKCREAGLRLAAERKASGTTLAHLYSLPAVDSEQYFENLAKTYHYRRPWFPQLRDSRRHPILSKLFGIYLRLSWELAPLWDSFRAIIPRKNKEKKGGAA